MGRHVLVPFDDSEPACAAVEFALSEYPDDEITVLQVFDPADLYSEPTRATIDEDPQQRQKDERLRNVRKRAIEQNTGLTADSTSGEVIGVIRDYVAEYDVDRIVIGSHGRSGVRRLLSGNVAETLSRRSPVPVTIVR